MANSSGDPLPSVLALVLRLLHHIVRLQKRLRLPFRYGFTERDRRLGDQRD